MKKIPVFLIQGFLDAGKTSFILNTLRRDKLFSKGKTLLISCEDGEIDYDMDLLNSLNIQLVRLQDEVEFSPLRLNELYKKNKPERILIEMNFLWDQSNITYPDFMDIVQIFTIIDGTTFPFYYQNMRQLFNNAIQISDVVAFTKLNGDASILQPYKQSLAVANYQCFYCIMNEDGMAEKEAFDSLLPYDLSKDEITIDDHDFGIFYIDSYTNKQEYENKIVTFRAWVARSDKLKKNEFIVGRKVLNCCAQDIQFFGFLVNDDLGKDIKHNSWVKIKAKCNTVYSKEYDEEEIVLTPLELESIPPFDEEILDLSK